VTTTTGTTGTNNFEIHQVILNSALTSSWIGHYIQCVSQAAIKQGGWCDAAQLYLNQPPDPAATNDFYTGRISSVEVNANLGGTDTNHRKGFVYAQNSFTIVHGGGTWLLGEIGYEIDMSAETGSSPGAKIGLMVAQLNGDTVPGVPGVDAAIMITNQGGTTGWYDGILVGTGVGVWPMAAVGNILRSTAGSTTNGIEFSATTFTGRSVNLPHLYIDGATGAIVLNDAAGGPKGTGTINAAGDIYKNNTAYDNPDYVLEYAVQGHIVQHAAKDGAGAYGGLWPLAATMSFAREHYALPRVWEARQRHGTLGAFSGGDAVLASLEEAYLYIEQLEQRLTVLEAR